MDESFLDYMRKYMEIIASMQKANRFTGEENIPFLIEHIDAVKEDLQDAYNQSDFWDDMNIMQVNKNVINLFSVIDLNCKYKNEMTSFLKIVKVRALVNPNIEIEEIFNMTAKEYSRQNLSYDIKKITECKEVDFRVIVRNTKTRNGYIYYISI